MRYVENPLIKVEDVPPSRPDFEVIGAFNAGVAEFKGETILLLRVAERPIQTDPDHVLVPLLEEKDENPTVVIEKVDMSLAGYDFSDSRVVKKHGETILLTSLSHLRIARSKDGHHFEVDETPAIFPETTLESWGIEDPRITEIDGFFYITYSAVSSKGVAVGLASTADFASFERKGLMLAPENKDVMIFPEKIQGKYYTLHRPVPKGIGSPEMWIAESPDLLHWGNHQYLMGLRDGMWDGGRIGGGAVPIKTDKGWLALYHGADTSDRYCMGAVLLDLEDPSKILGRSSSPILSPEAEYEVNGFFGKVVFSCGALLKGETIHMYYGAADEMMACAEFSLDEVLKSLI